MTAKRLGSGWHFESNRHALASKGIKTGTKIGTPLPMAKRIIKDKKYDVNNIYNDEDGEMIGAIDITDSPFGDSWMKGVYDHPKGKLFFEGNWEEGQFSIVKTKGITLSISALTDLEQELSDNYRGEYTDEGGEY